MLGGGGGPHSHPQADITNLATDLSNKAASNHNHSGTYSPVGHGHIIADVTGLQAALDGKQAAGSYATATHNHDGVYSLVGHTHPGGSDPWTYIKLASDFPTTSATAVDITGLGFTPAANTTYEFEAHLMCRTATATVGPRPGVAWAAGGSDGVASVYIPSSVSAEVQQHGNIAAAVLAPVGGLPTTTGSYGAKIQGIFSAGASPSGNVRLQLASETAGTTVTAKAGSFLKYRAT